MTIDPARLHCPNEQNATAGSSNALRFALNEQASHAAMGDELKTERLGLFVEAFFVTPSLF
jgi:hypothetical protein